MTPVESIYEIKTAVLSLQKYLLSKDAVVSKRAQIRYGEWVDRLFRGNEGLTAPQHRHACLQDFEYFPSLIESTEEYYD